jgi:phosphoglycerate-specific signal transduction histidine kinase
MYPSMSSELWARQHQQDLLQEASMERRLQARRGEQQARQEWTGQGRLAQVGQRLQVLAHSLRQSLRPPHGHAAR